MDLQSLLVVLAILLLDASQIFVIWRLFNELERLKRGDFTEAEFHNLCHNLKADDRKRFEQGCKDYQDKLFGCRGKSREQKLIEAGNDLINIPATCLIESEREDFALRWNALVDALEAYKSIDELGPRRGR